MRRAEGVGQVHDAHACTTAQVWFADAVGLPYVNGRAFFSASGDRIPANRNVIDVQWYSRCDAQQL